MCLEPIARPMLGACSAASLPRRVGAARPRIFVHTTGPNQGSGESRIRQRTVDTQEWISTNQ